MERGLSFRQLGVSFTWEDLKSFLVSLPSTSHTVRLLNPKASQVAEWSTPQMTLLGSIHDSLVAVQLLMHGVKPENLPKEGIREAFIKQLIQPKEDEQVADIEPKAEGEAPRKKLRTSADIRAAVGAVHH
ncbi:hypothetical protein ACL1FY_04240 [Corynebacterium striatum]|nr:hypothetical protein [Corynebacterium striatum]